MKTKAKISAQPRAAFTENEVRDYAYHLYEQSGRAPGHDVDNWLEAKACLEANVPRRRPHVSLRDHGHPEGADTVAIIALATEAASEGRTGGARVYGDGVLLLGGPAK